MKKFVITILSLLMLLFSNAIYGEENKKGRIQTEVELSYSNMPDLTASIRTGYLFNESIFVGGGISMGCMFLLKSCAKIVPLRYGFFGSFRYSIPLSQIINLSLGFDGGGRFELYQGVSELSATLTPKVGFGFKVGPKNIINIYANYTHDNKMDFFGGSVSFSF